MVVVQLKLFWKGIILSSAISLYILRSRLDSFFSFTSFCLKLLIASFLSVSLTPIRPESISWLICYFLCYFHLRFHFNYMKLNILLASELATFLNPKLSELATFLTLKLSDSETLLARKHFCVWIYFFFFFEFLKFFDKIKETSKETLNRIKGTYNNRLFILTHVWTLFSNVGNIFVICRKCPMNQENSIVNYIFSLKKLAQNRGF